MPAAVRLGADHRSAELRCGLNRHPTAMTQRRFATPQLACVWLLEGRCELRTDGAVHHLVAGDAFLRRPGLTHDVLSDGPAAWLYAALPAPAQDLLRAVGPLPTAFRPGLDRRLADRWLAAARRLAACPDRDLPQLAGELLALIGELLARAARAGADPWAERACRALDADPNAPIPAVAAVLGLSASGFRARFRASTGASPLAWRLRRRLDRAQELLADRSRPLAAVADALGYPDVPTFAKQFRLTTGVPPGRWRRDLG